MKSYSPWITHLYNFARHKLAMGSLILLLLITICCLCAPLLTSYDPIAINLDAINKAPSSEHWLGTDKGGRDIIARLLYGGTVTLEIAFSITLLISILGTLVGTIAGYYGGKIDNLLMRLTDFVLIFPLLIFVIVLKTIFKEASILVLVVSISILSWGVCARLVRGKVLAEKVNEYITAAISIGCPPYKVILKHLLPNIMSTIVVQAILIAASMITVETSLSFLGFGVPANVPSWGNMISDAIRPQVLSHQWWIWLPAGILITLTIVAINFIGEGVKRAFNPQQ
ncbi:oligopeptide ABC transporter permease [Paenibacillus psychroresistens]|nr:oligopeptide ABC transporter permease [Paenibacillus psychroresistens]